jgi:hypothetical protein
MAIDRKFPFGKIGIGEESTSPGGDSQSTTMKPVVYE